MLKSSATVLAVCWVVPKIRHLVNPPNFRALLSKCVSVHTVEIHQVRTDAAPLITSALDGGDQLYVSTSFTPVIY